MVLFGIWWYSIQRLWMLIVVPVETLGWYCFWVLVVLYIMDVVPVETLIQKICVCFSGELSPPMVMLPSFN